MVSSKVQEWQQYLGIENVGSYYKESQDGSFLASVLLGAGYSVPEYEEYLQGFCQIIREFRDKVLPLEMANTLNFQKVHDESQLAFHTKHKELNRVLADKLRQGTWEWPSLL